jgi:hypothetical protein
MQSGYPCNPQNLQTVTCDMRSRLATTLLSWPAAPARRVRRAQRQNLPQSGRSPWCLFLQPRDAASRVAVKAARATLNLPYDAAGMTIERVGDGVRYDSARRSRERAMFEATYEPAGPPFVASPGSLDYFLTERYCPFHHNRRGQPYRSTFITRRGRCRPPARRSRPTRWPPPLA